MFNWKWRKRRATPPIVDPEAAPQYNPRHAADTTARRRRPGGTTQMPDTTRGGWQ